MRRWRWYAWANCHQNLRKCIELYLQQVELIKLSSLFDFSSTHAISAHVKSNFWVVFNIELFSASSRGNFIGIKRCGIFLRIFWYMWKVCPITSPYWNAYAKVQKWIFLHGFPGNWFKFGIILNDFWSSIIWANQIQVSSAEFKNPKNPGIQPNHRQIAETISKKRVVTQGKLFPKAILTISGHD